MTDPIPHLGNPDDKSLKKYIITLKNFQQNFMTTWKQLAPVLTMYYPLDQ